MWLFLEDIWKHIVTAKSPQTYMEIKRQNEDELARRREVEERQKQDKLNTKSLDAELLQKVTEVHQVLSYS